MPKRIPLLPLEVGYFKTYEEDFSHFEVELYLSKTPGAGGGGINLAKKKGDTVELKGTRSGYMYVSGTHTFERLVKGMYYYIRYRVVTADGRHSQWQEEEQRIGDDTITFTKSGSSVISLNGVIIATVSIDPTDIPPDFKQLHWFVRSADFNGTIESDTVPDYITDNVPTDGKFVLNIPADANKKVYFVAIDYSSNKHADTAEYVGTVAASATPPVPSVSYSGGFFKLAFQYNFDDNPDVVSFGFEVSQDNGSSYTTHIVHRPEGGGTQWVVLPIPAIYDSSNNICYLKHQVYATNSIKMNSSPSNLTTNNSPVPSTAFSNNALTYANNKIKVDFDYDFSGNNADVKRFRIEVDETKSGESWVVELPSETTRTSTPHYGTAWEIKHGEEYTVNVYAVDTIGVESAAGEFGSITAPYDMQDVTQIEESADIFHFDKMGYGSVRGVYPSTIHGIPQLRGKYFSKFGGAVEFAEATTNTGGNPCFEDNTSWKSYSSGTGGGTRTFGYEIGDLDAKIPTALHLVKNDGGTGRFGVYQTNSSWSGASYTFSFYFKVISFTATARIHLESSIGGIKGILIDNSHVGVWTRVVATTSVADDDRFIWLQDADADVLITGWQAEAKAYSTPFDTNAYPYNKSGDQVARVAQYLKYPTADLIDLDEGSISFWFIPDFNYDYARTQVIHLVNIFTSITDRLYIGYYTDVVKFTFYMNDGSSTTLLTSEQTFTRGTRIFLTATWDTSTIYFYLNGVFVNSGTKRDITVSGNILFVGTYGGSVSSGYNSNGCIDELIFWKGYKLTDNEVKKLYELEVPNMYPNPIKKVAPIVLPSAGDYVYTNGVSGIGDLPANLQDVIKSRSTKRIY